MLRGSFQGTQESSRKLIGEKHQVPNQVLHPTLPTRHKLQVLLHLVTHALLVRKEQPQEFPKIQAQRNLA